MDREKELERQTDWLKRHKITVIPAMQIETKQYTRAKRKKPEQKEKINKPFVAYLLIILTFYRLKTGIK